MFIHIGGDVIVPLKRIVSIFDLERTTTTQWTRQFLKTAEEEGFLMTIGDDMPKSFVIVETEFRYQVYLSAISVATLTKRCRLMQTQPQRVLAGNPRPQKQTQTSDQPKRSSH